MCVCVCVLMLVVVYMFGVRVLLVHVWFGAEPYSVFGRLPGILPHLTSNPGAGMSVLP